jgi:hypothetical protein
MPGRSHSDGRSSSSRGADVTPGSNVLAGSSIIFCDKGKFQRRVYSWVMRMYVSPVALQPVGFVRVDWWKDLSMTHACSIHHVSLQNVKQ